MFDPPMLLANSGAVLSVLLFIGFPFGGGGDDNPPDDADESDDQGENPADCSLREIKKQIILRNQELDRLENDIQELEEEYFQCLKEGSDAGSRPEQKMATVRARLAKFKLQMAMLRRLQTLKNLTIWQVAKAQREVAQDYQDFGFGQVDPGSVIEFDPDTFQKQIDEIVADLKLQFSELEEVMSTPTMDLDDIGIDLEVESRLMEEIEPDDLNPDQFEDLDQIMDPSGSYDLVGDTDFESSIQRHDRSEVQPPEDALLEGLEDIKATITGSNIDIENTRDDNNE